MSAQQAPSLVLFRSEERRPVLPEQNPNKLNDIFGKIELFLVRLAVFIIFLIGLFKVVSDTLGKILK